MNKPSRNPQPVYQKPSPQKPERPRGPQSRPSGPQKPVTNQYQVVN
jgi:hypothetical protein